MQAELESVKRTFGRGRSLVRQSPKCPFPACASSPDPIFCETHWKLLDGVMRRELLTELRALTERGQRTASPKMRELFKLAVEEIRAALQQSSTTTVMLPPGSVSSG